MPKHPNSSVNNRAALKSGAIPNFRKDPRAETLAPSLTCKRIRLSQRLIVSAGSWIRARRGLSMGLCLPSWTNRAHSPHRKYAPFSRIPPPRCTFGRQLLAPARLSPSNRLSFETKLPERSQGCPRSRGRIRGSSVIAGHYKLIYDVCCAAGRVAQALPLICHKQWASLSEAESVLGKYNWHKYARRRRMPIVRRPQTNCGI